MGTEPSGLDNIENDTGLDELITNRNSSVVKNLKEEIDWYIT